MSSPATATPDGSLRASGNVAAPVPPWLSFSGRWPCVTAPRASIGWVNGSGAPAIGVVVYQSGAMIPMTSYHDARDVSYVADTLSVSPLRTATRQPGFV